VENHEVELVFPILLRVGPSHAGVGEGAAADEDRKQMQAMSCCPAAVRPSSARYRDLVVLSSEPSPSAIRRREARQGQAAPMRDAWQQGAWRQGRDPRAIFSSQHVSGACCD
jgi:hypothetical protein